MKKLLLCVIPLFALEAYAQIPPNFTAKNSTLNFSTCAPPALIDVEDGQGKTSGADFSKPVNQYGRQGPGVSGIQEIPLSEVEQQNIASDDSATNGQPQSCTTWVVHIWDGGAQTYKINLMGIKSGIANVEVSGFPLKNGQSSDSSAYSNIEVFVEPNVVRSINVAFNPSLASLSVQRTIGKYDLLNDVKSACALNLITSHRVCKHLEKMAEAIQDALEKHHFEEAEELVKSFLRNLGEDRGDGDNDKDDHDAIKEPALSILIADAKALLQTLPDDDHHDHGDR